MNEQKSVPQGKLHRGSIVGATAAKVSVKKMGHLGKRPFLSEESRQLADLRNDAEIARMIFETLSILRGTALKAAQLISMEMDLIPEVYRQELAKSASEVPAMNRALVRKVIKNELGAPEKIFAEFETTPFAAASLGQVHAAIAHDGRPLAVKVQYPGIATGVESDIAMLKTLLKPTKYARIFASCFDEVSERIAEELDYRLEATNTQWFSEHVAGGSFLIPEVVPELSSQCVLSTTRMDGLHLEPWLATEPSRAARDHYGQLLVDFFHRCTYEYGIIHADPNPGNFLFRDDGHLAIVDFGCVKWLEPQLIEAMAELMSPDHLARVELNPRLQEELHRRLGIHYRTDTDRDALNSFLMSWARWLTIPYLEDRFDFSQSDEYFAQGKHLIGEVYNSVDRYEGAFLYYGRTQGGLLRLLQRLRATVSMCPNIP